MKDLLLDPITRRLLKLNKIVECGFHSGIPACCIKFYVTKWIWVNHKGKFFTSYWERMNKIKFVLDEKGELDYAFQYIPCPKCLKQGKFIKILPCPKEAHCSYGANS